jgi:hypothetical protein
MGITTVREVLPKPERSWIAAALGTGLVIFFLQIIDEAAKSPFDARFDRLTALSWAEGLHASLRHQHFSSGPYQVFPKIAFIWFLCELVKSSNG